MGRFHVSYPRQRDAASEARNQAVSQATIQRQAQTSAYAAARFNEWAAGAQQREQILNARVQQANSQAELAGAQFRYNYWKDQELRNQTTHYYNAMPVLQEQLKQAGITPDTPRYAAEMAAFASTIPDALTHNEAIRKELHDFSKVAATSEQIASKIKTVQDAFAQTNQRPTSFTTTAAGGVDVKATRPIDEGLKAVGLSPTEFLNHVNAKQGKFDNEGKFTDKTLQPGEQATAIQFQAGAKKDDRSQLVTHSMPLQQFNQLRSGLGVEPLPAYAAPGDGASPSTTPAPQVTPTPTPTGTPNNQAALDWANKNPNDPRAQQIIQLNSQ